MSKASSRNRFRNWEYENQLYLLRLIESAQEILRKGLLQLVRLFSFGAYLLWVLGRAVFVGPALVQRVCPQSRSLQRHEFEKIESREFPQSWIK